MWNKKRIFPILEKKTDGIVRAPPEPQDPHAKETDASVSLPKLLGRNLVSFRATIRPKLGAAAAATGAAAAAAVKVPGFSLRQVNQLSRNVDLFFFLSFFCKDTHLQISFLSLSLSFAHHIHQPTPGEPYVMQ